MYLRRNQYANPELEETLTVSGSIPFTFQPKVPTELKETIGYWSKVNQIHAWFGENDCREYDVERQQLDFLLEDVRMVLSASKLVPGWVSVGHTVVHGKRIDTTEFGKVIEDATMAKRLLPRASGCFFGGEGYDEDYVSGLEKTVTILKAALASLDDVGFTYQSSW